MFRSVVHYAGSIVMAVLIFGGCTSSSRSVRWSSEQAPAMSPEEPPIEAVSGEADLAHIIGEWLGTPHRWGGQTLDGVDCSAFVRAVVRDAYKVELPRTAAQQLVAGRRVSGPPTAGDLVFFRNDDGGLHVGLAMSSTEFAHASSSRGVVVDHIDDAYWSDRLVRQRRVLPAEVSRGREHSLELDGGSTGRRPGW